MVSLNKVLRSLFSLFYPKLCLACGEGLPVGEDYICLPCQYKLPKTDYHLTADNDFTARFWGRVPLHSGAALYHFHKGGRAQRLIHQLKYKGQRTVGVRLGEWYGLQLREADLFKTVERIVPVPLHPKRQHFRGYNQSAAFAQGLSTTMGVPWSKSLRRPTYTQTQTRKSRLERFDNVATAFELVNASHMTQQHVLLVDDVITTGATLEACAHELLKVPGLKLSMATIAIAGQNF